MNGHFGTRLGAAVFFTVMVSHATTVGFTATENPISQGGTWINGLQAGLLWSDVQTVPGLAFGTETGSVEYNDSTAVLTGTWDADQSVSAVVYNANSANSPLPIGTFEEVELRLLTTITAGSITGYEINFSVNPLNPYVQIVRWDGGLGDFSMVPATNSNIAISTGDVVSASVVGGVINAYVNNVLVATGTDTTYTSGSPGMGFYLQGPSVNSSFDSTYGFSSFTATGELTADPPSVPEPGTVTLLILGLAGVKKLRSLQASTKYQA